MRCPVAPPPPQLGDLSINSFVMLFKYKPAAKHMHTQVPNQRCISSLEVIFTAASSNVDSCIEQPFDTVAQLLRCKKITGNQKPTTFE